MTRHAGIVSAVLLAAAVAYADPPDDEAAAHLARGVAAYRARNYPSAQGSRGFVDVDSVDRS